MKKKIMGGIVLTGLLGALVAGGTMAWFTSEAEVAAAVFTAGTVEISAGEAETTPMDGKFIENINPGDSAKVSWDIVNSGTKAAELRVKLSQGWVNQELSNENVHFTVPKDSKWVRVNITSGDDEGTWFYYTGGPVEGTYSKEGEPKKDPVVVPLTLIVGFDGEATHDDYQAQVYQIGGDAEAIQSTNGAPEAVWGGIWTAVKAGTRNDADDYFTTAPGSEMEFIKDPEAPVNPPVDPNPIEPGTGDGNNQEVERFTVTVRSFQGHKGTVWVTGEDVVDGKYAVGSKVTVHVEPNYRPAGLFKYTFKHWQEGSKNVGNEKDHTFEMRNENMVFQANFK